MIFLIGTNHELQHFARPKRAEELKVCEARYRFQEYLRDQVQQISPNLIAEEMAEELLKHLDAFSTVKVIAEEFKIEHRYCDPGLEIRLKLGIPPHGTEGYPDEERRKYHNVRENYWYEQITPYAGKVVLFICGAEHVSSFRALLMEHGWQAVTLCKYWGKEIYNTKL